MSSAVSAVAILVVLVVAGAGGYYAGISSGGKTTTVTSTVNTTVAASVSASSTSQSSSGSATGEPISIGLIAGLTSYSPDLAKQQVAAATMAINEINANGGLLGRPLKLIVQDEGSGGSLALTSAQILISQDHVTFLLGPFLSGDVASILPFVNQNNIVEMVSEASADSLMVAPQNAHLFRVGVSDQGIAFYGVEWAKAIGAKTVVFAAEDYLYAHEIGNETQSYLAGTGITLASQDYFPGGATDYSAYVNKLASLKPDAVLTVFSGTNGIDFQKQYASNPVTQKIPLIHLDSSILTTPNGVQSVDSSVPNGMNNVFLGQQITPNNLTAPFIARWAAANPTVPYGFYGAEQYQTVMVLANAVKLAGSLDTDAVSAALMKTNYYGPYGHMVFQANHNPTYGTGFYTGSVLQVITSGSSIHFNTVMPRDQANASMINPATGSPYP